MKPREAKRRHRVPRNHNQMPDDEGSDQDIAGVVIEELQESQQSSGRGGEVADDVNEDSQTNLLMRPGGTSGSEGGLRLDSNAGADDEEIGIVEQQDHLPGLLPKKKPGRVEPAGLGAEVPSKTRFAGVHQNFTEDQEYNMHPPTAMPTADLPARMGSVDFEPKSTRNTTFLGGIFDTVKMKMSQTGFRKIMPKSDDEEDVHQFELQQLMDLPDGILR